MLFIKTNKHVFALVSFIAASFLLSFAAVVFNPSVVSAHTLTVTTSNSINLDVTPNGDGTSIKTESINVASTCRSGYNLSISTPEGSDLYQYDSTNDIFDSTASFTAVDGTSALSSSSNTNKWGYTLTSNASTSTVFSPLSSTASVLKTYSQTASPNSDINDTFNINYGVKVDSTISPGNYQMANHGAIVYYATVEPTCLNYTVQYQDGGADNPNGMGTTDASTGEKSVKQINIAEGTTITLLPPNFKKQGHSFLGWSTDQDAYTHFTDNDNTNDPVIYGPMETVTIDSTLTAAATTRNLINMYPVWLPALRTDPSNQNSTPVYFQDWDNPNTTLPHDGCSTLTATIFDDTETNEKDKIKVTKDSVVALTDKRDNEVYTVARLADGNCWMAENLRLEAAGTMGQNINDPNVTNQYLSQGYGGTTGTYGNFVGLAEAENANFSNTTTSNTVYKSSANPPLDTYDPINLTLEDIGTTNYPGNRFPRYDNSNTSNALNSPTYIENYINSSGPSITFISGTYKTSSILSYGNYYSWAAAMANTNYYTDSSTSESTGTSICPSGWHLPSGDNTSKEYSVLSQRYGGTGDTQVDNGIMNNRFRSFPNNNLYSGHFNNTSIRNRGGNGKYWSRSASANEGYAYVLTFNDHILYLLNSNSKYEGKSIRCLISSSDIEIVLDSNNSIGAVSRVYGESGNSVALPSTSTAELHYAFNNWNTAPDGSGTTYTSSFTIPAGSTGETLYAQWIPQYTITYVNNCMSWASGDANCNQTKSDTTSTQRINLDTSGNGSGTLGAYDKFTMTGWKIKEWTTNADGTGTAYPISSAYSITGASAGDGITLYAHWIPVYSIQYDGNNADNPNGMGTTNSTTGVKSVKQTNVGEGDPVTLLASNFKKAGNGCAGWSTDPDAWIHFTDNDSTNDPVIYGPMETIAAPAKPAQSTILTLYAVWVPAEKDVSDKPIYLQEWDDPTDPTDACAALTSTTFNSATSKITATKDSIIALTDKRDDEVYTIAKLADDNCWMIENLRLEHEGTVGNNKNDSSVTNQSLAQGYGGTPGTYGSFVGLAASESANFTNSTTPNTVYKSSANPPVDTYDPTNNRLEDIGTSDYPGGRIPRYNNINNASALANPTFTENYGNATSPSTSGIYKNSTVSSYGNYYNWVAAMANTNYITSRQESEAAGTSICPSGWYLPSTNGANKEYGILSQGYGGSGSTDSGVGTGDVMSNRFRTFPNNFLYSGMIYDSSVRDRGWEGNYWSNTSALGNSISLYFSLGSTRLNASNNSRSRYNGFSVRCLINP